MSTIPEPIARNLKGRQIPWTHLRLLETEVRAADEKDLVFEAMSTTPSVDSYGDTIDPLGADLSRWDRNRQLLYMHDWFESVGQTVEREVSEKGIRTWDKLTRTRFVEEYLAPHLLAKSIRTKSIGFTVQEETPKDPKKPFSGYVIEEWTLFETSWVTLPANPDAEMTMMKALGMPARMETRGVIPYKKQPLAAEDAAWDGPAEVAAAEVSDLKIMCAWVETGSEDLKGAYKLPHHRASDHYTVWRGVAAAMAALLGGRGGVDIPDGDRRGVYDHLARHYQDFDKEPPEFKSFDEIEWQYGEKEIFEEQDVIERVHRARSVLVGAGNIFRGWHKRGIEVPESVVTEIRSLREVAADLCRLPDEWSELAQIHELMGTTDTDQIIATLKRLAEAANLTR